MIEAVFALPGPLDLRLTLAPLRSGPADPTLVLRASGAWRATNTPEGPATTSLAVEGRALRVRAWGPGAAWAVAAAPALVGSGDDPDDFRPRHPRLADLARRLAGLRIPRSSAVVEALVPIVLAQKVTGGEAARSYASLVRALGQPAPGPAGAGGLRVPPPPERLAATPSHALHRFGIERKRAETLRRACRAASQLEETTAMAPAAAARRLTAVPGIGPWTAASVALVALGDADAAVTGDYHLPHQVAWALAGEARADDARMLELLAPYAGHRARAQRLIVAGGTREPRFGPRLPRRSIAAI